MPQTMYFQIVSEVIDSSIKSIAFHRSLPVEEIYQEVVKHMNNNSSQWRSNRTPRIPYQDPFCRIAYLFNAVAVNANLIEFIFRSDNELSEFVDEILARNGQVDICNFGGGPGTEILGMAKWIEKRNLVTQYVFNFLLLDKVSEWSESIQSIRRQIESRFRTSIGPNRNSWPVIQNFNSCTIDFTDISNFAYLGEIFKQDLFILSYVISEIFEDFGDFIEFLRLMVNHAPSGAKFLFIDRNGSLWTNKVQLFAEKTGLVLSKFHYTNDDMDGDERREDLGQIYRDVANYPRSSWNAFWVVGTKP